MRTIAGSNPKSLHRIFSLFCIMVAATLTNPQTSLADWDWKAGFGGRNTPFGASGSAEIGYGQLLWGEAGPGKYLYGYIRPLVRYQGVGVVSRGDLGVDLNPVSFLNFRGGVRARYRMVGGFDTLDCGSSLCEGLITSPFAQSSILLGGLGFYFGAAYGWERLTHGDSSMRFAEEFSSLYGAPGTDSLVNADFMLGREIVGNWSTGLVWQRNWMLKLGSSNDFRGVFARNKWEKWSGLVGVGLYESSTRASSPVFFFQAEFQATPTLELN